MTLTEAVNNLAGWQEAYQEAKSRYNQLKTGCPEKVNEIRRAWLDMVDAKESIEWYLGYDITDTLGNTTHIGGAVQKLANEAQRLRESMNLGVRFLDRTFDNFKVDRDRRAFNSAVAYARQEDLFRDKRNSLLISGNVGSGKTHLAAAIANDFVERGVPTMFGTFQEHLERIKEEFDNTKQRTYLSKIKNIPVLVIDDLGKERKSEWSQSILFDIVNYRYEHLLPIIFTSNFDDTEFANYCGTPVWSRLNEMCGAIRTTAGDYRRGR